MPKSSGLWRTVVAAARWVAGIGLILTLVMLVWIYSSRELAWKQVAFIEDQLARSVAA